MWIAFRTIVTRSQVNVVGGDTDFSDDYQVVESEEAARTMLERWQADPATYCAGVAKIVAATEPHFVEG